MDGFITIGTKLDTKKFDAQILDLERKVNEIEKELSDNKKIGFLSEREVNELNTQLEKTKNKLAGLYNQKMKLDASSKKNALANSFQSAVKQAGRLALAIFGIRSAYMLLRGASSELATYDSEYAANLEYIRFVLTQAIAPVLRGIVNLAMQLLQIIGAITQSLFGFNIFANGSVEAFNKMKSSAGGVGKAVKEIKKALAGFDEINRLADNDSSGGGGGGIPGLDISGMQGETPEWLKWITDNSDLILALIAGLTAGITAWKIGLGAITALGIGTLVTGLVYAIQGLIEYLKDPSFENFGKVIQGIGVAVIGLGILVLGLPGIIAGVAILILGTVIKYWDKIKDFLQKGIDWLSDKSDWVHEMFGDTIGRIYDLMINTQQLILNAFNTVFRDLKQIFNGIIDFIAGIFTKDWERAWNGLTNIFLGFAEILYTTFDTMLQVARNKFIAIGTALGGAISEAFKFVVNMAIRKVETILNSPIRAINLLIRSVNLLSGVSLPTLSTFSLPKLKSGAILNVPNKGTLVGGGTAIAGEAGREGYLPLTDQQAMSELGREIGKNVLINLTNITSMNGRVISRELKNIQNEQNFAYNT